MTVYKSVKEGYKISVWVYRATRTIIQAASAIPWIVVDKNDEPIWGHPLEQVFKNPNPEFSGQDLIEILIAHLELVGNALWQPIIVGNRIKEIWPVMPDLVRPIPSDVRGEWLKGWQVTIDGKQEILPPHQFIHFMQVDPGNPYWGISPLMAAARTVDTDNEAQDTQKISMQNRGLADVAFVHEAPLTTEQFEEARRQVREKYLEKSRRREPWILGAGAKPFLMSMTPVEMDFIASRLANMRAIAAAFGLDPWWLGDKQASTFSNVAEARKALYEDVVIPLLDDVRATINLKISPMYGDISVTYDLSGVPALREDFGKKVDQAKSLWAMGVPFEQINTRLEMGFEEFNGWESGYLPLNLLPTSAPRVEEEEEGKSYKSLNLESEEAKTAYWKALDRRRLAYWSVVAKQMEKLYAAEAKAVAKALRGRESIDEAQAEAERAIKEGKADWEKALVAILVSLVADFGERTAEDLGMEISKGLQPSEQKQRFDVFSQASRLWIARQGAESVRSIIETNLLDVRNVILQGKVDNLTVTQIGSKLRDFYADRSAFKAMRVARTEVAAASSYGNLEAARQSGVVKKKRWLTSRDDRVRDSHEAMDGEPVELDGIFSNGCEAPGICGDPAEAINCRCILQFFSREPR